MCVAAIDPGVMTAEKLRDPAIVEPVNATGADFLIVALGAQKGQAWLMASRDRLTVPVVSHLGATLNFLAGTVRRAPGGIRRLGLEWLWRVKEEPKLAARYLFDGLSLLWILVTRILPLSVWLRWPGSSGSGEGSGVWLDVENPECCAVTIAGVVGDEQLAPVVEAFRSAAQSGRNVELDFQRLKSFRMGFAGLVLMLEKTLHKQGQEFDDSRVSAASRPRLGVVWLGIPWVGARQPLGFSSEALIVTFPGSITPVGERFRTHFVVVGSLILVNIVTSSSLLLKVFPRQEFGHFFFVSRPLKHHPPISVVENDVVGARNSHWPPI